MPDHIEPKIDAWKHKRLQSFLTELRQFHSSVDAPKENRARVKLMVDALQEGLILRQTLLHSAMSYIATHYGYDFQDPHWVCGSCKQQHAKAANIAHLDSCLYVRLLLILSPNGVLDYSVLKVNRKNIDSEGKNV